MYLVYGGGGGGGLCLPYSQPRVLRCGLLSEFIIYISIYYHTPKQNKIKFNHARKKLNHNVYANISDFPWCKITSYVSLGLLYIFIRGFSLECEWGKVISGGCALISGTLKPFGDNLTRKPL